MTVHLTCGKICSGKTFFAQALAEQKKAALFSADELMLALHAACLGEKHRETEFSCVKYLLKKAAETAALYGVAVIDHGFWFKDEREYAARFLAERGAQAVWHYFDGDYEIRLKRLLERNERLARSPEREYVITEEMLRRFDEMFEPIENR